MPAGRPTLYTKDLSDAICARLAKGESMRSISRDADMPVTTTLFRWLRENPEFKQQYETAKEESADCLAEELVEIADDGRNDWIETNDPDNPGYKYNGEHVQRSRLRVDARKWIASKLKPKKYGEKISQEHIINGELKTTVDASKLSTGALKELLAAREQKD